MCLRLVTEIYGSLIAYKDKDKDKGTLYFTLVVYNNKEHKLK